VGVWWHHRRSANLQGLVWIRPRTLEGCMTQPETPPWTPDSFTTGGSSTVERDSEVTIDFPRWFEHHAHPLAERWLSGLRLPDPSGEDSDGVHELVAGFLGVLLEVLPHAIGPLRSSAEPLWVEASELYGTLAAQRGLAAGEVIEEFQILREAVLRLLWADPPEVRTDRLALREILRLNRVLDRGVTAASVGHTDALFFALFQSAGIPPRLSDDLRYEMREQLQGIRRELSAVVRAAQKTGHPYDPA